VEKLAKQTGKFCLLFLLTKIKRFSFIHRVKSATVYNWRHLSIRNASTVKQPNKRPPLCWHFHSFHSSTCYWNIIELLIERHFPNLNHLNQMIFESSENDTKLGVCVFFLENGCGRLPDVCWTCLHSRKNLNFKKQKCIFFSFWWEKVVAGSLTISRLSTILFFLSQPFTYQSTF
jgi:hypothetical protein